MDLGKLIQAKMKAKKISAKTMADFCGVTPSAVSSWFRTSRITKGNLAKAAELLQISMEELVTGEQPAISVAPTARAGAKAQHPDNDVEVFAYYLAKFKDRDLRDRACNAAMQIIYSALDGQWPKPAEQPTPTPAPASKKQRDLRHSR